MYVPTIASRQKKVSCIFISALINECTQYVTNSLSFNLIVKGEPIWTVVWSVRTPGKHRAVSRDAWPPHRRRHARCLDDEGAAGSSRGDPNTELRAQFDALPLLRFGALPSVHELKRRRKVGGGGVAILFLCDVTNFPESQNNRWLRKRQPL